MNDETSSLDNLAVVRGAVPDEPQRRALPSGGVVVHFDVSTRLFADGRETSASVPIALSEAVATGRVRPGDLVVLTAFGAGFHWGAAAIRFSG